MAARPIPAAVLSSPERRGSSTKLADRYGTCSCWPAIAPSKPLSAISTGFWQGLLRVVGSFGDCPRCLAVCPVGNDYHAHLSDAQKAIPEKTPEKVALGKSYRENRAQGAAITGLSEWNKRWVGPEGYKGMVARQLQEFKKMQQQRSERALAAADEDGRA
jgi:hypothetical protein